MADDWGEDESNVGKSFGGNYNDGAAANVDGGDDAWNSGDKNENDDGGDEGWNSGGGDAGGFGRGGGRGRGRGRGGRGRGGRGGGRGDRGDGDGDGDRFNNNKGENGGAEEKPREIYIPPEPTEDENEIFGSGISSGINFDKYDKIPISVTGENTPEPVKTFQDSGLKPFLLENVRKSGYTVPTPIQKHAIPIINEKRDMMACAQTGSGKTAAFLLPIINDLLTQNTDLSIGKPQALIVSPTRELSIQIFQEARKFALGSYLKITNIYGGTAVKHQGDNIGKGCHILVATPGRLIDFIDRGFVTLEDIRFLVLDEADRMLDMGFLGSMEKILKHETLGPQSGRQTLMFSATFPEDIQRLAGQFLTNYIFITVGIVGGACSDVEQNFYRVTKFEKRSKLTEILEQGEACGTIVFVETKRNADFLASLLSETKFPTTSIHGDRLQREREQALRDFKTGKMTVLIATSVAARGLDIKNVAHVVNYDLPKSIDDYVHRIGRTGRVGNRGKASSFYDPDQDSALAEDLVKILQQAEKPIPDFLGGGGGGDSGNSRGQFGGRDVRDYTPAPQEPEEQWG